MLLVGGLIVLAFGQTSFHSLSLVAYTSSNLVFIN